MNAHTIVSEPYHPIVYSSENACDAISRREIRALKSDDLHLNNRLSRISQSYCDRLYDAGKLTPDATFRWIKAIRDVLNTEPNCILFDRKETHDRVRRRHQAEFNFFATYRYDEIASEIIGIHMLLGRDCVRVKILLPQIYVRAHVYGRYMRRTGRPMQNLQKQIWPIMQLAHFQAIPLSRGLEQSIAIALPEGILFGDVTPGTSPSGYGWLYHDHSPKGGRITNIATGSRFSGTRECPDIEFTTFYGLNELTGKLAVFHKSLPEHQNRIADSAAKAFGCEFFEKPWDFSFPDRDKIFRDWESATTFMASPAWTLHAAKRLAKPQAPRKKRIRDDRTPAADDDHGYLCTPFARTPKEVVNALMRAGVTVISRKDYEAMKKFKTSANVTA